MRAFPSDTPSKRSDVTILAATEHRPVHLLPTIKYNQRVR